MDPKRYGGLFKALRLKKGITQFQLSEGICSERHIKNIESGRNFPNFNLLSRLSDKLGHQVFELALLADVSMDKEGYELYNLMEVHYKNHDFLKLKVCLTQHHKKMYSYHSLYIRQKLLWYEGLCMGAVDHNYNLCQSFLTEAWEISYPNEPIVLGDKYLTQIELHIFNSIASTEYSMHNHIGAIELYKQLNSYLKHYNIQTMQRLYLLSCYNLLKCYNKVGDYEKAIAYGKLHLEHSEQQLSMELLAETYYELGLALIGIKHKEEALIAFKKSMGIAQLFRKNTMIDKVMIQLEKKYGLIFDKDLAQEFLK